MPISAANKENLVDVFLETKRKGHRAEIRLRFQRKDEDADKIAKQNKKLSKQIDMLIAQSMRQWNGSASAIISDMKQSNTKLQKSVNSIKKKMKVAENVVKIIGYIDDGIERATKLIV